MNIFVKKAGYTAFLMIIFAVFFSKAAVNILEGVLFILFLVDSALNKSIVNVFKQKYVLAFILPLCVGFILSFFSTSNSGIHGPVFFLERYRHFLIIIPFSVFILYRKQLPPIMITLNFASCIAIIIAFVYDQQHSVSEHLEYFLVVRRNSDLLSCVFLLNAVLLFEYHAKRLHREILIKVTLLIILAVQAAALFIIKQRGALVGLSFGIIFYALFFNRKLFFSLIIITIASVFIIKSNNVLMDEIRSFNQYKYEGDNARHDLYISGFFYVLDKHVVFGTGMKQDSDDFMAYYLSQDQSFQNKYVHAKKYAGNFHNSYIQMAAEGGVLFLLLFVTGISYSLFHVIKRLGDPDRRLESIGALTTVIGGLVVFFFHEELYSYGGIILYLVLFQSSAPYMNNMIPDINDKNLQGILQNNILETSLPGKL